MLYNIYVDIKVQTSLDKLPTRYDIKFSFPPLYIYADNRLMTKKKKRVSKHPFPPSKPHYQGLTLKQQKFIDKTLETGSPQRAVQEVYNTKYPTHYARETLDKPLVIKAFAVEMDNAGITDSVLAKKLGQGVNANTGDKKDDLIISHRYLKTALQAKGHLDKRVKVDKRTANINLDVKVRDDDNYQKELKLLNAHIEDLQRD